MTAAEGPLDRGLSAPDGRTTGNADTFEGIWSLQCRIQMCSWKGVSIFESKRKYHDLDSERQWEKWKDVLDILSVFMKEKYMVTKLSLLVFFNGQTGSAQRHFRMSILGRHTNGICPCRNLKF